MLHSLQSYRLICNCVCEICLPHSSRLMHLPYYVHAKRNGRNVMISNHKNPASILPDHFVSATMTIKVSDPRVQTFCIDKDTHIDTV